MTAAEASAGATAKAAADSVERRTSVATFDATAADGRALGETGVGATDTATGGGSKGLFETATGGSKGLVDATTATGLLCLFSLPSLALPVANAKACVH